MLKSREQRLGRVRTARNAKILKHRQRSGRGRGPAECSNTQTKLGKTGCGDQLGAANSTVPTGSPEFVVMFSRPAVPSGSGGDDIHNRSST